MVYEEFNDEKEGAKRRIQFVVFAVLMIWITAYWPIVELVDTVLPQNRSFTRMEEDIDQYKLEFQQRTINDSIDFKNCIRQSIENRLELNQTIWKFQNEIQKQQIDEYQRRIQHRQQELQHRTKWIERRLGIPKRTTECSKIELLDLKLRLNRHFDTLNWTKQHNVSYQTIADQIAASEDLVSTETCTSECEKTSKDIVLDSLKKTMLRLNPDAKKAHELGDLIKRTAYAVQNLQLDQAEYWDTAIGGLGQLRQMIQLLPQNATIDASILDFILSKPLPQLSRESMVFVENASHIYDTLVTRMVDTFGALHASPWIRIRQLERNNDLLEKSQLEEAKKRISDQQESEETGADENAALKIPQVTMTKTIERFEPHLPQIEFALEESIGILHKLTFIPYMFLFLARFIPRIDHLSRLVYSFYLVFIIWMGTYTALPIIDVRQLRPYANIEKHRVAMWIRTLSFIATLSGHVLIAVLIGVLAFKNQIVEQQLRGLAIECSKDRIMEASHTSIEVIATHSRVMIQGNEEWSTFAHHIYDRKDFHECHEPSKHSIETLRALVVKQMIQTKLVKKLNACFNDPEDEPKGIDSIDVMPLTCDINITYPTFCSQRAWDQTLENVVEYTCSVHKTATGGAAKWIMIAVIFLSLTAIRIWLIRSIGVLWWKHMNFATFTFVGSCTAKGVPVQQTLLRRDARLLARVTQYISAFYVVLSVAVIVISIAGLKLYKEIF